MSSRLFQKIREKRGWAYSIYAYASFYKYAGLFTIYGGINKSKFFQTLTIIFKEFGALSQKTISAKELRKVKEQLKGHLILSLERSASWMNWMGRSTIYFDRVVDVQEIIDQIESVSVEDLQELVCRLVDPKLMSLSAIGPLSKKVLECNQESMTSFLKLNKLDVL